ncbi:MAG: sugar ABC transporter permease [Burkholderiaceae bacterium]
MILLVGPLIAVLMLSFTDYSLGNDTLGFVGLQNYAEMLGDEVFRKAIVNTVLYVAIVVPGSTLLGLGAALLIEHVGAGKSLWRAVYFLPVMSTLIAMAIVWEFMLNARFGLLSQLLQVLGLPAKNWLQEPATALPVLCAIGIWQTLGFNMVLFLAGLSSVPRDLYEALELDGGRRAWDRFQTVTWPLLSPVTMFVVVITAIRSFQVFDTVHVLTKGGPNNASMVLVYEMYQEGFEFFRSAYASALTVIFLLFVFALTFVKARLIEKRVHYQ